MRQFFKYLFASMLGFILGGILLFFIIIGIVSSVVSSMDKDKKTELNKSSVLYLDFQRMIQDRASNNPLENLSLTDFSTETNIGLNTVLENIKKAKTDNNIKGIFIELTTINSGIASVEEIRNALLDFKQSGKPIICYSEGYSQKSYYLASAANKVYLNPQGGMDFKGLSSEIMFFKGLLEKADVEPQVIRHGRYKSAVEPFILDKMSVDNRAQTKSFIQNIWNSLVNNIAVSRNISKEELNRIADNIAIREPEDAVKYKLVDKLVYKDEVLEELKVLTGKTKKDDKPELITLKKYNTVPGSEKKSLKDDQIAVIYASGEIESGEGTNNKIGSETVSKAIREARLNDKIKAIVLRVNSPGGSALASEVIWREADLANKVKPVVVSMGDVAASGGYYISSASRKIFASPNTITGSIGVFGVLFNTQKLLTNKLGITTDTVKTNRMSDFASFTRPLTGEEKQIIQQSVEKIYDVFTKRVADNRKIKQSDVDSIGQGRVWSGIEAKEIGLIDEFGGLNDAIAAAAKMANAEKYRIVELPKQKDPFKELMSEVMNDAETKYLEYKLGDEAKYFNKLSHLLKMQGIQARMPYDFDLY
ncbi:MAG: signal peptide peptidase SppA [Bacteroidia bacterium]|nr:signal peptide peptidase SppA [Bacteroidia bacterium]MCZ2247614.1 signal peptide peptidase SppA [Bacteroidia bacterium]